MPIFRVAEVLRMRMGTTALSTRFASVWLGCCMPVNTMHWLMGIIIFCTIVMRMGNCSIQAMTTNVTLATGPFCVKFAMWMWLCLDFTKAPTNCSWSQDPLPWLLHIWKSAVSMCSMRTTMILHGKVCLLNGRLFFRLAIRITHVWHDTFIGISTKLLNLLFHNASNYSPSC